MPPSDGAIDAHQHFWRVERGDYGWLTPELQPLYRDYGPEDLGPHLDRHGIARTIVVQAAPTAAETEYLLGVAEASSFAAGVVGWTEFSDRSAPATIARFSCRSITVPPNGSPSGRLP